MWRKRVEMSEMRGCGLVEVLLDATARCSFLCLSVLGFGTNDDEIILPT